MPMVSPFVHDSKAAARSEQEKALHQEEEMMVRALSAPHINLPCISDDHEATWSSVHRDFNLNVERQPTQR